MFETCIHQLGSEFPLFYVVNCGVENESTVLCIIITRKSRCINTLYTQYGVQEMGVVYPREMTVSVELDPGDITCSDMTDTSCTTVITSDGEYTARVTVSNDIGSTVREETFQCEFITTSMLCLGTVMISDILYSDSTAGE